MSETKYIDLNAENLQEDDASRADKIENEHIDKQQESDEATEKRATVSENVHKAIIGVLFGLGVCFSWVASTQFSQSTYSETFYGPFFITWFLTLWMMVCYPAYILGSFIMFPTKRKAGIRKMYNEDQKLYGEKGLTWLSAFKLTGPFLLMWAGTNYVYLRALGSTSATVVTTLFVTNTAFVYILSWVLLSEVVAQIPAKTLSVLLSIGGTVLISYAEGFQKGGTRIDGVLLALLAACGAALYKVIFKRVIGDATYGQVSLFLTILGFFDFVFLWPILVVLYYTGQESWEVMPWGFLCGSAALGVVFNFLVNFGIAVTFPLLISLGHVLGIPINGVVDFFFRGMTFEGLKLAGACLIFVGFVIMVLPTSCQEKLACCCFRQKKDKEGLERSVEEEEESLKANTDRGETVNTTV